VPDQSPDDRIRLAREALAAAKAAARTRGPSAVTSARGRSQRTDRAAVPAGDAPAGDAAAAAENVASQPQGPPAGGTGRTSPTARQGRPTRPARPRRDDPQPLSLAIDRLLEAEGWTLAAATGSVFGRWAQIVGPELAAHTSPESLTDGELTVTAASTAWATQVRLLSAQLIRRLNSELGDGAVQRVKVRGPVTAQRKPGEWRVRGTRGPRDTYG
jgi:predicted nucleic acid-binding Zn ribbon protein